MKSLDLHGVKHRDVKELVDSFIGKYLHLLPLKIVTGNSADMQRILKSIVISYRLKMEPINHVNLGSYIIK